MTIDIAEEYAKLENEWLKFENVEPKLSSRPDIHAFILLNQLCPGTMDIVTSAEHDKIWLDIDIEALAEVATVDQIRELEACGAHYDTETDSLYMSP